jgi:tryptophanase
MQPEQGVRNPLLVYTWIHIVYVVEVILEAWKKREQIHAIKLSYEAPFLRHFTSHLAASSAAPR